MPATVEAELVARLASYDKNMKERAGDRVHVVILVEDDDGASERAASSMTP